MQLSAEEQSAYNKMVVKVTQFNQLLALLGNVKDGSCTAVSISQDDATEWWNIKVGSRIFHEETLSKALDKACEEIEL